MLLPSPSSFVIQSRNGNIFSVERNQDNGGKTALVWIKEITQELRFRGEKQVSFLPPSVRQEAKGLSELLLSLRYFSDILIFWKIFKVNKAKILTF